MPKSHLLLKKAGGDSQKPESIRVDTLQDWQRLLPKAIKKLYGNCIEGSDYTDESSTGWTVIFRNTKNRTISEIKNELRDALNFGGWMNVTAYEVNESFEISAKVVVEGRTYDPVYLDFNDLEFFVEKVSRYSGSGRHEVTVIIPDSEKQFAPPKRVEQLQHALEQEGIWDAKIIVGAPLKKKSALELPDWDSFPGFEPETDPQDAATWIYDNVALAGNDVMGGMSAMDVAHERMSPEGGGIPADDAADEALDLVLAAYIPGLNRDVEAWLHEEASEAFENAWVEKVISGIYEHIYAGLT